MKHIIIGTAGHIDHGKTMLIRALTGRDTDTLKEEKERGISINLGFTYFDLPSGKRAGIVDVPGHEKFIKNMLAGVSGIDMVLLVIAADEGIMPQTREHMNILSLLDVKNGIIVVTKKDLVDDEWLEVVMDDIRKNMKGSFLESAEIIPVSSVTGEGIDTLVKSIDRLSDLVPERDFTGSFRLPVDRVFSVSGFGTVITGTLISGIINEGDRIQIYPKGIEARTRNIQVHEEAVKTAYAGQRVALNLSGVKLEEIKRGDTAAQEGSMEPSMMLDCRLNYLKDAGKPLENYRRLRIYHGTSELLGRVVILDRENVQPGEKCLAQIRLESPICARKGDKYVVRAYSPMVTLGGGTIIDPNPPKRKRFDKKAIDELLMKEKGNPEDLIEHIILKNSSLFPNCGLISKLSGMELQYVRDIVGSIEKRGLIIVIPCGGDYCYLHKEYLDRLIDDAKEYLSKFHDKTPLKAGMPKEEFKSRIFENGIKQKSFDSLLQYLQSKKIIKTANKYVALFDFSIKLNPAQNKTRDKLLKAYSDWGLNAPKSDEVISMFKGDADAAEVLNLLLDSGSLIKINQDMILSKKDFDNALDVLKNYLLSNGCITAAQYRNILETNRKCAVSLLEYFDEIKITKRTGDNRYLI